MEPIEMVAEQILRLNIDMLRLGIAPIESCEMALAICLKYKENPALQGLILEWMDLADNMTDGALLAMLEARSGTLH